MRWRVMCALTFNTEDEAKDLYHDIMKAVPKANPLPDDYAHYHYCTHDEIELGPCEVIKQWHAS